MCLLLAVTLGAGQLAHVRALLGPAMAAGCVPWGSLSVGAVGALGEAALPLVCLVAAALVYGRLRRVGGHLAWAASGGSPLILMIPAGALGVTLGGLSVGLSSSVVPESLTGIRADLEQAAICTLTQGEGRWPLPGGGVLQLRQTTEGREIWAMLPASGDPPPPPTLVRARGARWVSGGGGGAGLARLLLMDAYLWSPGARVHVAQAEVTAPAPKWHQRLATFGPPNATPSVALELTDPHQRFVWHRRLAIPSLAPWWALLGAALGLRRGSGWAILWGASVVVIAHWIMRAGELSARHEGGDAALAAWAPVVLVSALTLWLLSRARR